MVGELYQRLLPRPWMVHCQADEKYHAVQYIILPISSQPTNRIGFTGAEDHESCEILQTKGGDYLMDLYSFLLMNWTWIIYWTITIVALVGVVLNIEQDSRCFFIWAVTNAAFAIETFLLGAFNMTFLFSIYFLLALVGIHQWQENSNELEEART